MAPTKAQQSRLLTVVQARDLNQGRVPPQGGKAGDSAQPLDTATQRLAPPPSGRPETGGGTTGRVS